MEQPKIKENLMFMFKGSDGKNYYRWPKAEALSNERYAKAFPLISQIAEGMSAKEKRESIETFRKLASGGVKNFTQCCAVVELMAASDSHIIHKDILLNLCAIYIIREDEDPITVNNDLHNEKLKYLDEHISTDPHAFFLSIAIEALNPLSELSQEEQARLWMESPRRMAEQRKFLERLLLDAGFKS